MPLEIRLLGGFEVVRDGRAVSDFRTLKARALLVYLALHGGRPLSRAMLAGLLWPEQTTERATHSLRQALTFLRQALDPAPLLVTRDEVRFEPSEDQSVDVIVFERDLETGTLVALA